MATNITLDDGNNEFFVLTNNGTTTNFTILETVIISLLLIVIIIGTIIGNILVCVAVCLVRKLRRPCNYLLVSLAISDLCVAILVMPMAMFYEIHGRWIFGEIVCNLWVSCDVLSCTASILNLCMISVDRYYAITKPLEYGVRRTPKRMIICVILVWCFAACISLPPLLIIGNEHSERMELTDTINYEVCLVSQDFGYQLYATLCSFYIPLTVMMIVYYKIFRAARRIVLEEKRAQSHLDTPHYYVQIASPKLADEREDELSADTSPKQKQQQSQSQINNHHRHSSTSTNTVCSMDKARLKSRASNESQCPIMMYSGKSNSVRELNNITDSKAGLLRGSGGRKSSGAAATVHHHHQKKLRFHLARERKASTTLGIIMSAFTCCWLPFFVLALIRPFLETTNTVKLLGSLFLWLGYANSLLNPIIYATLNRDFRKPFQAILYFRCGSLNHMMREDFYHSQYGDPELPTTVKCQPIDYGDELAGADEYRIDADGKGTKRPSSESFL